LKYVVIGARVISADGDFERAVPGPIKQAALLRDFVAEANVRGIDYNIIEAIRPTGKTLRGQRRSILGHPRCVVAT
jgi:hypothetical protein